MKQREHFDVRRDNVTSTIVVRDNADGTAPWIVVWPISSWLNRHTDAEVAGWPWLNQGHYSPEWVEGERRARKALQRENGRLSAVVGQLRAELARERERRREKGEDEPKPVAPITTAEYAEGVLPDDTGFGFVEVEAPETTYWIGDWSAPDKVRRVDKAEYERHTAARMAGPTTADLIAKGIHRATTPPEPEPYRPFGTTCYSTPSGAMVHVKSYCRCRERRFPRLIF